MTNGRRERSTDLAKALSHPLRRRLLVAYNRGPASPSEAAAHVGAPLGNVAYHTKKLVELGCLELVGTGPGRGGTKHTYRARVRYEMEDDTWTELPRSLRGSMAGPIVSELGRDIAAADLAGGLEDEDVHLSRLALELDERAWRELSSALRELVARADAIAAESAARGAGTRRSVLALMHFRTGEGS